MHPAHHAAARPDHPAIVMAGDDAAISYAELDRRSNRAAHLLRRLGLKAGDVIAVMLENHPRYFEIAWGAQRAGLYMVGVSSRLTAPEVAYIVRDSGARMLVTSPYLAKIADALPALLADVDRFTVDAPRDAYRSWDAETAVEPATPITDERGGIDMLYSSGTTGRPKGVRPPLPADPDIAAPNPLVPFARTLGFDAESVYLCPAPLYHAAPLRWCMTAQRLGGTVIVMERFDAEEALALIERYRVTHSQWVPTHFVRMLRLPEAVRARHDLSSQRVALHAAAPCPVPVKRGMIDWWGPILVEYYAGTESNGLTTISSAEWETHQGSVGRAVFGTPRICGEDGEPLPPRVEGAIYFQGGPEFVYHNDPEKTAASRNARGWTTMGDIGWLDEEGYLYLTDRKSFTIISGGVNIYPQEIENLLLEHPDVLDAAVVGAPDADLGEMVVAVVQPVVWADAGDALAGELTAWLRERLSGFKMPRRIDFLAELPRHPTGKLYKRLLRDGYWGKTDGRIV